MNNVAKFALCLLLANGCVGPVTLPLMLDSDTFAAVRIVHEPNRSEPDGFPMVWHALLIPTIRTLEQGMADILVRHCMLMTGARVHGTQGEFDFFTCANGESQRFQSEIRASDVGRNPHWQVSRIDWCDQLGTRVVAEVRAVGAEPLPGNDGYLLVVDTALLSVSGDLAIDGDPYRSGIQLAVTRTLGVTDPICYLRDPDSRSVGDVWRDCSWVAAVLQLHDGPVTVLRVEDLANPKANWATRNSGTFGSAWDVTLKANAPTSIRVYLMLVAGARDQDWCATMAGYLRARGGDGTVTPPNTKAP